MQVSICEACIYILGKKLSIFETVVPVATDTLERSQTTLTNMDRLLGAEYPTGHELKRALTELADAARNISVLADYLGRHPESLVFGKDKHNEK